MSVGEAIGGVAQAGATLVAGYMQNKANERMNADNLRLAYIQRGDTLAQNKVTNRFAEQDRAFRDRESTQDRAYRDRESAYQKLQDQRASVRQRLNDDAGFRNNIVAVVNAARRPR